MPLPDSSRGSRSWPRSSKPWKKRRGRGAAQSLVLDYGNDRCQGRRISETEGSSRSTLKFYGTAVTKNRPEDGGVAQMDRAPVCDMAEAEQLQFRLRARRNCCSSSKNSPASARLMPKRSAKCVNSSLLLILRESVIRFPLSIPSWCPGPQGQAGPGRARTGYEHPASCRHGASSSRRRRPLPYRSQARPSLSRSMRR